ncbi:UNVERIFIED_CONTAM: hypothetical protein K2H54_026675 [Gekko kuhli]
MKHVFLPAHTSLDPAHCSFVATASIPWDMHACGPLVSHSAHPGHAKRVLARSASSPLQEISQLPQLQLCRDRPLQLVGIPVPHKGQLQAMSRTISLESLHKIFT